MSAIYAEDALLGPLQGHGIAIVCDSCGTAYRTGRGTERNARLLVWTQGWSAVGDAGVDLCPDCVGETP